jgi:hypothetical protein
LIHGDLMSVTGSSGAIMGVMVAYAMLNPDRQFFLFPLPIPITARALVIILIAMNLISAAQGGNTSVATHLGGMAVGFAYMRLIPVFRRWQRARWQAHEPRPNHWRSRGWPFKAAAKKDPLDATGEAVDNIFKFEDRKNRP